MAESQSETDEFLADCRRLLSADLRKSLPTKGAYQDALRQAVARLEAVAALADRFDGYGHGVYSTHMEEQLPCSVCALLGDLRSLLGAPARPASDLDVRPDAPTRQSPIPDATKRGGQIDTYEGNYR